MRSRCRWWVDGDTGFGNALNMARTIRVLERSGGRSAIQIEDQDFPKRCGHFSGKAVIDAPRWCRRSRPRWMRGRIRTSPSSRARIRARSRGSRRLVERLHKYHEAGAEATFLEAPETLEEIRKIPKVRAGPRDPQHRVRGENADARAGRNSRQWDSAACSMRTPRLQAALAGMQQALAHLHKQGSLKGAEKMLAGFAERQKAVTKDKFDALEKKYALPDK